MAESMQNFAYHPSVASWVQSTALAQFDGASDEVAEQTPDDFYKAAPTASHTTNPLEAQPPVGMTTTRQRQTTPNGAVRSTPKPSVRSMSGSVTSTNSTPRSAPQVPSNRPTVKSLAQKFNQPASADSSPLSSRSRTVRPASTSKESPSYGGYKFNNLKARERPQPAPQIPGNARRSIGVRSSLGQQQSPSPSKKKVSSPAREPARQPFFGEVVGDQKSSTPGFGILNLEEACDSSVSAPPTESPTIKLVTEDVRSLPDVSHPPTSTTNHQRSVSDMAPNSPQHRPPSRIPVPTRRTSASSSSSTSTRNSRFNSARPVLHSRSSPTRIARLPVNQAGGASRGRYYAEPYVSQPTLPAGSYRGFRERGKTSLEASNGPSVPAVITAPPPPTSPRLRNSRERQLLQESPGAIARSADPNASQDYFGSNDRSTNDLSTTPYGLQTPDPAPVDSKLSVKLVDGSPERDDPAVPTSPQSQPEVLVNGQDLGAQPVQQPTLTISTDALEVPPAGQLSSTSTRFDFEESPILGGMPGSFLMTPPMVQNTPPTDSRAIEAQNAPSPLASPQGELLQARTFQPTSQKRLSRIITSSELQDPPSELGSREFIPIMLGTDGPANEAWDATPKRPSQLPRGDESPIDPFTHRQTLGPDDSASMVASARPRHPVEQHLDAANAGPMSIRALEADPEEPVAGGTAIIFPTESKRYSVGSHKSQGSTATTIWEGLSRPDSSSGLSSRERRPGVFASGQVQIQAALPPRPLHSPPPPPPPSMGGLSSNLSQAALQAAVTQYNRYYQPVEAVAPPHPVSEVADWKPAPENRDPAELAAALGVPPEPESEQRALEPSTSAGAADQAAVDEATLLVRKRYRVIEELTKTEHSFCVDMMVAHQIFEKTANELLTEQERRLLFGNCKDVEAFAHAFWKALKDAIKPIVNQTPPDPSSPEPYNDFLCCTPENDRQVRIGDVIMNATTKMERVYTTYYLNYSDASDFIKKNTENPQLLGWVAACFSHCPNLTQAWDLDSLLVKPCQRMLKYPIILDDLIAKTAPDHPDLLQLKNASQTIKNIANRIEDAKSRQQTLRAATSEGKKKEKKGSKFSSNIVKALKIKNDRGGRNLQDAAAVFEDKEYNQITQKFGGHFFQIQIVLRDYDQYLDAITDQMLQLNNMILGFITVSETGPSAHPEMESTWRRWAQAHIDIQNWALDDHKESVKDRIMKPIAMVWDQWVQPQKLMEQRKKLLLQYARYKLLTDKGDKVDQKLEDVAKDFMTINDSLKLELPKLYEKTKKIIRLTEVLFLGIQKDWYKTCSKKILPLLEDEPQHTTSISYDFKVYVDRFRSDFCHMEDRAKGLAIINHDLLNKIATFAAPTTPLYSDDSSSRKSSSRRTESIGSDYSLVDQRIRCSEYSVVEQRNRNSGGYGSSSGYASSRSNIRSTEGPPRSSPAASYPSAASYSGPVTPGSSTHSRGAVTSSTYSQGSDSTATVSGRAHDRNSGSIRQHPPTWPNLDGAFDDDLYAQPSSVGPSFLNPTLPNNFTSPIQSTPGSSRTSGVFSSALPMSNSYENPGSLDNPTELPVTPRESDDSVEVLFLAASLFEFNIAHDRREGGIPYLVYVPGEIFDVIGMKGELWLARNQDDSTKTVGWIWEKHFARILPEDNA